MYKLQFLMDKELVKIKEEIIEYVIKKIENKLFSCTNSDSDVKKDTGNILSFHYPQSIFNQNNNVGKVGEQRTYYILNFYFKNAGSRLSVTSKLFRYQNTKEYTKIIFETKDEKNLETLFKAVEKEIVKVQLNNMY